VSMRRQASGLRHQVSLLYALRSMLNAPPLPFSPSFTNQRILSKWFIDRTGLRKNTFIEDDLIDSLALNFHIKVSGSQGSQIVIIPDTFYPPESKMRPESAFLKRNTGIFQPGFYAIIKLIHLF